MRKTKSLTWLIAASVSLGAVAGCDKKTKAQGAVSAPDAAAQNESAERVALAYNRVQRSDFNRLAQQLNLPLFWSVDAEQPGTVTPTEVVAILTDAVTKRSNWVDEKGEFTPQFQSAYQAIVKLTEKGQSEEGLSEEEALRRALVRQELDQGRPTLLRADLSNLSDVERSFVSQILEAGRLIDQLYAKQTGAAQWQTKLPAGDPASHALFFRNQGPWCRGPATEENPKCSAVPEVPKQVFGLYPAALQGDSGFCDELTQQKDGEFLMGHFGIVNGVAKDAAVQNVAGKTSTRTALGPLLPVPYSSAYEKEMNQVASLLESAAATLTPVESESAMVAYLTAAAKAFRDNNWFAADKAWSQMNGQNSKWYLRIGPDEVYFEPCNRKAGFHMSFAKINPGSLEWQEKLSPVKQGMEAEIAKLAGAPYKERAVSFHLPDFIDIVMNSGDSRKPFGGTIGQSLPNWGPVAENSQGRTVVMTNLYEDEDSRNSLKSKAESLLCADTIKTFTSEPGPMVMSIVLHEAGHNLGPSHDYKVKKKTAPEIFGGPMASMLEELKAQSIALYFTNWLVKQGTITQSFAHKTHVRDVVWAFGHIARGMYTPEGKPRPYSQLAAIQLGSLLDAGALTWNEQKAANGTDMGCFSVDLDKFGPAVETLMGTVAKVKGSGDIQAAKKLVASYVDVTGAAKDRMDTIEERFLRGPKASFVYSVELQ